ncbi:uncharacterized protein VTP21DRAFT_5393 [Calcarisporiella thermophila]|uniref:uncharacterized protein n=1 Tax=Calcarisporiella thermophila TaxID=911321 RepID=UPI003743493E
MGALISSCNHIRLKRRKSKQPAALPESPMAKVPSYLLPAKPTDKSLRMLRRVAEEERRAKKQSAKDSTRAAGEQKAQQASPPQKKSFNIKFLEGRSYAEGQAYLLPVDKEEANRLVSEYFMLRAAFGCNYFVPIEDDLKRGIRVLDVGCGPGLWLMEMATEFPNSEFMGIDVQSMMFPSELWPDLKIPKNTSFDVMDVLKLPLPFEDGSFDFVHQRQMATAIPKDQWPAVLRELKRITKPGGWIQLVETDLEVHPAGEMIKQINFKICHATMARGLDPFIARYIDRLLAEARVYDLESFLITVPIGNWGKAIGQLLKEDGITAMQTWKPWLCRATGTDYSEYEEMVRRIVQEWDDNRSHVHFHVAYGRRPLAGEESGAGELDGLGEKNRTLTTSQLERSKFYRGMEDEVDDDDAEGRFSEPVFALRFPDSLKEKGGSDPGLMLEKPSLNK